jgi:hypothetical protein
MVRRKYGTTQRGCMTITKIEIHGFEEPFVFNERQLFQEWRNRLKLVVPKAGELRILAETLFAQQNGIDDVQVEETSSDAEESIVDPSFLDVFDMMSWPDPELKSLHDFGIPSGLEHDSCHTRYDID